MFNSLTCILSIFPTKRKQLQANHWLSPEPLHFPSLFGVILRQAGAGEDQRRFGLPGDLPELLEGSNCLLQRQARLKNGAASREATPQLIFGFRVVEVTGTWRKKHFKFPNCQVSGGVQNLKD